MKMKFIVPLIVALISVSAVYMIMSDADSTEAAAGTYTDGNWTFNVVDGNATIVSNTATGYHTVTTVNVPATVSDGTNTYNVTVLGNGTDPVFTTVNAVSESATLTLPDGLVIISDRAFYRSSSSWFGGALIIPDSVTSIGQYAFNRCNFTSITLPDDLTAINDYAFQMCGHIDTVNIPDSVISIGQYAFAYNSGTTVVNISDSVTSIGDYAFRNCSGLTSLDMGNGVQIIGNSAFYGCTGLTGALVIPDSVTSIGGGAFSGCTSVTTLIVEGSPTTIGTDTFNMTALETVYNLGTNDTIVAGAYGIPATATVINMHWTFTVYNTNFAKLTGLVGSNISNIDVPVTVSDSNGTYTVKFIGDGTNPVLNDSVLTDGATVSIPEGIAYIDKNAFNGCTKLTGALIIPDSMLEIRNNAFDGCTGLTSLDLGEGVGVIGSYAFNGCTGLTGSLILPDTTRDIGQAAFKGCTGITSVDLGDGVQYIGWSGGVDGAFENCSGLTGTLTIPDSARYIGPAAFKGCTGLTTLDLGNGVAAIYSKAFSDCTGLTGTLTIPDSMVSIASLAFNGCSGFTALDLGEGVDTIDLRAFGDCTGLTGTLSIPDVIRTIGMYAFSGCTGLTALDLGEGVETISVGGFENCSGLTGTVVYPVSLQTVSVNAFNGCDGVNSLVILGSPTFGDNALNMANCSEVLNLGDSEITSTSYGLNNAEVRADVPGSGYIAPVYIVEYTENEGPAYMMLALLPLLMIMGALIFAVYSLRSKL